MEIAPGCEEHGQKAPAREGERSEPGLIVALDLHSSGGGSPGKGRNTPAPVAACYRDTILTSGKHPHHPGRSAASSRPLPRRAGSA